jgi:hypothetical protein
MEHLIHIADTYYGITLKREDGEPAWPTGWSLERFNNMNVMEVFEIPHGVSYCACAQDVIYDP